jgi:hypothetical protein
MKLTKEQFKMWDKKAITLLGMSGVGKTYLSNILPKTDWFHFSGDYRIGTRYLSEAILDNIKMEAMNIPFLRELLRSDSIYIANNITVDNLIPISSFIGKLGDPELGGLSLKEFKRRQALHYQAEVSAMLDVPEFICKANKLYGFNHFINDAGGSLCELDNDEVLKTLDKNTLVIYIKVSENHKKILVEIALKFPKPLYYRERFLDKHLADYMEFESLDYVVQIRPDHFVKWVFEKLFDARIPHYEAIAKQFAYTVSSDEVYKVKDEKDFLQLIESKLD